MPADWQACSAPPAPPCWSAPPRSPPCAAASPATTTRNSANWPAFRPWPTCAPWPKAKRSGFGDLVLHSHATPGHAPGGTSWTWRSCEGPRCVDIAYVDSHSALTDGHYRFADHPDYVAAFERSLDTVAGLPCDLLLTPHPAASNLLARLHGEAPLVDGGACKAFSANARTNLAVRLADERKEPSR